MSPGIAQLLILCFNLTPTIGSHFKSHHPFSTYGEGQQFLLKSGNWWGEVVLIPNRNYTLKKKE
jgi:hypothetical protein